MGFYPDKVFPEEVDNIKEFMRDTFSTNINAYSLSSANKQLKEDISTSNYDNPPANFLQEDEINLRSNYYNNPRESQRGIDSTSLNRRFSEVNQRRMSKNFMDESDNNYMMDNIQRREKNENYGDNNDNDNDINSSNNGNRRNENYDRNTRSNKAAASSADEEKANTKGTSEISVLLQKSIGKTLENKASSTSVAADNAKKNNNAVKKEKKKIEAEINNHNMLRKLR